MEKPIIFPEKDMDVRAIAYFLPQFHKCEFNEQWWGKGFTEWTNVEQAKPLRSGHFQPRVPVGGKYDLLSERELEYQFSSASSHGIEAFAFYHYWYEGQRPLGKPLDLILARPDLKIKFSLCWANHSWTRTWRNRRGSLDVLIEQTYGSTLEKRQEHFEYLCKAFSDERYTMVNGKPLFQIYVPEEVPSVSRYCDEFREYASNRYGFVPHLAATVRRTMPDFSYLANFDSVTLAQPILGLFASDDVFAKDSTGQSFRSKLRAAGLNLPPTLLKMLFGLQDILPKKTTYFSYDQVWRQALRQAESAISGSSIDINLSGFVDFDNTPRYKKSAKIIEGFTPEKFGSNMRRMAELASGTSNKLLFVNAWNEWGEGMHLQGDERYPVERLAELSDALK